MHAGHAIDPEFLLHYVRRSGILFLFEIVLLSSMPCQICGMFERRLESQREEEIVHKVYDQHDLVNMVMKCGWLHLVKTLRKQLGKAIINCAMASTIYNTVHRRFHTDQPR